MKSPASTSIAGALFPRVRQRVLAILYGNPDRSFFLNEIVSVAQSGTGAEQRELATLAEAGLLTARTQGNQRHYQANASAPVFAELRGLVLKTSGVVDVLRSALAPLASQIDFAFVYGSVARQEDSASSDVDVMLVSPTLGYADAFGALEGASGQIARKINPTVYTPGEWRRRREHRNAFITRVLQQPKLWLIGSEDALRG